MIAMIVMFGWMKKRENERSEQRLRRLKIEAQNEEQKRIARNQPADEFADLLGKKPESTRNSKGGGPVFEDTS